MLKNKYRILECNSSDNKYLHKDFYGALSMAKTFLWTAVCMPKNLSKSNGVEILIQNIRVGGSCYFLAVLNMSQLVIRNAVFVQISQLLNKAYCNLRRLKKLTIYKLVYKGVKYENFCSLNNLHIYSRL